MALWLVLVVAALVLAVVGVTTAATWLLVAGLALLVAGLLWQASSRRRTHQPVVPDHGRRP